MPVYIVAHIEIKDPAGYAKYPDGFLEIFGRYDGEILGVSDEPNVIEGESSYTRAVLLRFQSHEDVSRWYDSPEYQALAQHRWDASKAFIVSFEGFK